MRLWTYLLEESCELGYIAVLVNLASWLLVSCYFKHDLLTNSTHSSSYFYWVLPRQKLSMQLAGHLSISLIL